MKDLPQSEVYEQEFKYMPWGRLIDSILTIIQKDTKNNGHVLDLMCGPGYLLGEISKRRADLKLEGVDISDEFISHAQQKYQNISFKVADVMTLDSAQRYDLILCTGGIHHLPYDKQEVFLSRLPGLLNADGFAIFADPYIDDYADETQRKQAAAKLGYEYLAECIKNGATDEVNKAAIDILYNDVFGFEYKTSIKKLEPVFKSLFSEVKVVKTWPDNISGYGDYYVVCRK